MSQGGLSQGYPRGTVAGGLSVGISLVSRCSFSPSSFIFMKTRVSFSLYFLSFGSIFLCLFLRFKPCAILSSSCIHQIDVLETLFVLWSLNQTTSLFICIYVIIHLLFSSLFKEAEITLPYSLHIETIQQQYITALNHVKDIPHPIDPKSHNPLSSDRRARPPETLE